MGATHLVDSVVACAAEGLAVEDIVDGRLQSTPYGLVAPERIRFSRAAGDFDTSALQSLLVCEMHRGERDAIFTSPLSSEPKCLSFIALLLEAHFYHAQDRRRCKSTVRRVMHHPVGVSLTKQGHHNHHRCNALPKRSKSISPSGPTPLTTHPHPTPK